MLNSLLCGRGDAHCCGEGVDSTLPKIWPHCTAAKACSSGFQPRRTAHFLRMYVRACVKKRLPKTPASSSYVRISATSVSYSRGKTCGALPAVSLSFSLSLSLSLSVSLSLSFSLSLCISRSVCLSVRESLCVLCVCVPVSNASHVWGLSRSVCLSVAI